jgi:two-component system chemotaxis response regulator CheB
MRVLLVDDSAIVRGILTEALVQAGFEVVGQASGGARAVELAAELRPDLVIMDINMPVMDGLTATRHIMDRSPVPILIFSSEVGARTGFEAVSCGAVDIMRKPSVTELNDPAFSRVFLERVRAIAGGKRTAVPAARNAKPEDAKAPAGGYAVVVMGASTGGPLAVRQVLEALPADFPLGIAVVQHMEDGFDRGYADWLAERTALKVRLAKAGDALTRGEVLVAPVGKHLRLRGSDVALDDGPRVLNQKPSVDVLFRTASESHGTRTLGVLLTGMGRDGAEGCREIVRRGGRTLVQDEATSAIFGMPRAAIEMQGATEVLALDQIGRRLQGLVRS